MKRIVFFLCLIIIGIKANAQDPNIILSKPVGQSMTIRIALQTAGSVDVDWGNGTTVPLAVGTTQTIAGATQLTGTVGTSGSVKIHSSTNIVWMNITNQGLTGVDITNNPALRAIDMSTNNITSIDLSNNVSLQTLGIHTNNQLAVLDVTANINLTTLTCNNNLLTNLDVSNNTKLTALTVSANSGLNSLDISSNVDLTILRAAGIGLSSIDLTNNTKISELNLRSNSLTSLDLSNNALLGSTAAVNLGANNFSAAALNQIFMDLPTLSTNRALSIDLNPGVAASATSIAVAKNWTPNATGDGSSLPLTLLSFTGELKNNIRSTVSLNWRTAEEVNTKEFVIERAGGDGLFSDIGAINAKNVSGINLYSYIDENPLAGISYYRLRQIDIDGKFTRSSVVKVENNGTLSVNVYPVPVKNGKLFVQYPTVQASNAKIEVYSVAGQRVFSADLKLNTNNSSIDVSKLTRANYILFYKSAHQIISKKITIQ